MTLATHIVVGAAVAELFPSHPAVAFFAGFASHFFLDAIPHWDYKILSSYANPDLAMSLNQRKLGSSNKIKPDKFLVTDLLHISTDIFLGLALVLIIWQPYLSNQFLFLALGAVGAILPDFLQFFYTRFPFQPMVSIQKFHSFMHANYRLKGHPIIGVVSQVLVILCVVVLVKYLIQL